VREGMEDEKGGSEMRKGKEEERKKVKSEGG